jgi:hypothetical protein
MYARQAVAPQVNALALAQMFGRPMNSALYLPQAQPSFQAVAADVDGDGDEDQYSIRYSPITLLAGCVLATTGGVGDITFEPQKWTKVLEFVFDETAVAGILVYNFTVGQAPMFPVTGYAMPLSAWAQNVKEKLIDVPWCGPNTPLILSLKNTNGSEKTIWGGARAQIITG